MRQLQWSAKEGWRLVEIEMWEMEEQQDFGVNSEDSGCICGYDGFKTLCF